MSGKEENNAIMFFLKTKKIHTFTIIINNKNL